MIDHRAVGPRTAISSITTPVQIHFIRFQYANCVRRKIEGAFWKIKGKREKERSRRDACKEKKFVRSAWDGRYSFGAPLSGHRVVKLRPPQCPTRNILKESKGPPNAHFRLYCLVYDAGYKFLLFPMLDDLWQSSIFCQNVSQPVALRSDLHTTHYHTKGVGRPQCKYFWQHQLHETPVCEWSVNYLSVFGRLRFKERKKNEKLTREKMLGWERLLNAKGCSSAQ